MFAEESLTWVSPESKDKQNNGHFVNKAISKARMDHKRFRNKSVSNRTIGSKVL